MRGRKRTLASLLVCLALAPGAVRAQVEDVFGDLGTADAEAELAPGQGFIVGQVLDAASGAPVSGATVILIFPPPADGGDPRQEVAVTDAAGFYEFPPVPVGSDYQIHFVKAGYRTSKMVGFEVIEGEESKADFPLEPLATQAAGDVLELDAFVVEASTVNEIMAALELRLESDQLLNVMSAEDLSKFAASDVADALKRVAGVNVVEGQFAVIRGLEDRYSATLFNGAPVPSPDPERQSVQLDLFPSDVVSNLAIAKTFSQDSSSNASSGSIDISTAEYPDAWTASLSAGSGFNDNAIDEFFEYDDDGADGGHPSPIGRPIDGTDTIESDYSFFLGGKHELLERELRLKFSWSREIDYKTALGTEQDREPGQVEEFLRDTGDLALGELSLPGAKWDFTESDRELRQTWFVGAGIDLDPAGRHRIDASFFQTRKDNQTVQDRRDGFFPDEIYAPAVEAIATGAEIADFGEEFLRGRVSFNEWVGNVRENTDSPPSFGVQTWFAPVFESRTFDRERNLTLYQLNGEHELGLFDLEQSDLKVTWATNYATSRQEETTFRVRYWYEPDTLPVQLPPGDFPFAPEAFGPGRFSSRSDIVFGDNEIDEEQLFGRLDLEYEIEPASYATVVFDAGVWYEQSERNVDSRFVPSPAAVAGRPGVFRGGGSFTIQGATPAEMGDRIFLGIGLDEPQIALTSDAEREILAGHGGLKLTLYDDLDLFGGVRFENLEITSENDPFTGFCGVVPQVGDTCPDPLPVSIFPSVYVLFDRIDNPNVPEERLRVLQGGNFVNNDELLNIPVTVDPDTGFVDYRTTARINEVINGKIDENYVLPSIGFTYRAEGLSRLADWTGPLEGLTLRGAFSKTLARPSLREIAYYASLRSNDDAVLLGNPLLEPSEVTSWDARLEYTWGDFGDLFAFSVFYKTIEEPIETITVKDPRGVGVDTFRTWRNNPSDADLLGFEVEGRVTLGYLGPAFLEYFSIGANGTFIEAEVERLAILQEAVQPFLQASDEDIAAGRVRFRRYKDTRPLTQQPEWIVNADFTFNQPDWRTSFTAAFFAISDVLDTPQTTDGLSRAGTLLSFQLDRYNGSFHQLDLIFSQGFDLPYVPGEWTFKTSVKNVTDSERTIIYDPEQTRRRIKARSLRLGRDYSFSLGYRLDF